MLTKVLIANRGEIACRIIRTARRLGIATVAVYSDVDAKALHVAQADEAVHIGPSPAPDSYLRIDKIIAAAKATGADAIHPGYGFLSENAELPAACTAARIAFIGPSADAMRALGGKAAAKLLAIKAGVPVVPGYQGAAQDLNTLKAEARRIGYPVMIKAVAGGGGRGMRLVESEAEFASLLDSAQREAKSAFGNDIVLIEKFVVAPRHIEVQVFGDSHGNVVHLFERDCSLQRRNQKVIEEAPAPGMSAGLRAKICGAAVQLAKSVGYQGAGTVEFLVEGGKLSADAPWYFIEMNTRLQVEHPVTEEITGLDLVEWQFRVASGEALPLKQTEIAMSGHAIEARLCAEDPTNGFMPSVGKIVRFDVASNSGLRLETGVEADGEVSPFYDSMIAKLIAPASDRARAIQQLLCALEGAFVAGPQTNIAFLRALLGHAGVRSGDMDTGLIARDLAGLTMDATTSMATVRGAHALIEERWAAHSSMRRRDWRDPWIACDGFLLGAQRKTGVRFDVDGKAVTVGVRWVDSGCLVSYPADREESGPYPPPDSPVKVHLTDNRAFVVLDGRQTVVGWPTYDIDEISDGSSLDTIRAPINGRLAKIMVAEGDVLTKGDKVAVVEAMKMEHVLHVARDGTIGKIAVKEGAQVIQGMLIASLAVDAGP